MYFFFFNFPKFNLNLCENINEKAHLLLNAFNLYFYISSTSKKIDKIHYVPKISNYINNLKLFV